MSTSGALQHAGWIGDLITSVRARGVNDLDLVRGLGNTKFYSPTGSANPKFFRDQAPTWPSCSWLAIVKKGKESPSDLAFTIHISPRSGPNMDVFFGALKAALLTGLQGFEAIEVTVDPLNILWTQAGVWSATFSRSNPIWAGSTYFCLEVQCVQEDYAAYWIKRLVGYVVATHHTSQPAPAPAPVARRRPMPQPSRDSAVSVASYVDPSQPIQDARLQSQFYGSAHSIYRPAVLPQVDLYQGAPTISHLYHMSGAPLNSFNRQGLGVQGQVILAPSQDHWDTLSLPGSFAYPYGSANVLPPPLPDDRFTVNKASSGPSLISQSGQTGNNEGYSTAKQSSGAVQQPLVAIGTLGGVQSAKSSKQSTKSEG